jgi:hypothetical protein
MVLADRLQGGLRIHIVAHVLPSKEWRVRPWKNVQRAQQVNEDKQQVSRVRLAVEHFAQLHVSANAAEINITRGKETPAVIEDNCSNISFKNCCKLLIALT